MKPNLSSITFEDDYVKLRVPKELYNSLVKLQASENLDFFEALSRAAVLLDKNGKEFKRSVENHAQSLYKSRLMNELNKSRKTIEESAYDRGAQYVRRNEDNFRVSCSKCGKFMFFSSRNSNWKDVNTYLIRAFHEWYHVECD
jgi:hypothetical protein